MANVWKSTYLKNYAVKSDKGPTLKLQRVYQLVVFYQFTDFIRHYSLFPKLLPECKRLEQQHNDLWNTFTQVSSGTKDDDSVKYVESVIGDTKFFDGTPFLFNKSRIFKGGNVAIMRFFTLIFSHHMERNVYNNPDVLVSMFPLGVYRGASPSYATYDNDAPLNNAFFGVMSIENNRTAVEKAGENNTKLDNLASMQPKLSNKFVNGPTQFGSIFFEKQLPDALETEDDKKLNRKYTQWRNNLKLVKESRLLIGCVGDRPVPDENGNLVDPPKTNRTPRKRTNRNSAGSNKKARTKTSKSSSPSERSANSRKSRPRTPKYRPNANLQTNQILLAMYEEMRGTDMINTLAEKVNMEVEQIEDVISKVREGTPTKTDPDNDDMDIDDDCIDDNSEMEDDEDSVDTNEDELDAVTTWLDTSKNKLSWNFS